MAASAGHQETARRYATAFFALATEQSQIDQIAKDMDTVKALLASGGDIDSFLNNGTLQRAQQSSAIIAIAKHLKLSPLSEKLLGTLASKRRLPVLADVVAAVQNLIAEQKGEVTAEVTAAQALDQAQIADIEKNLAKVTGKNVRVNLSIDPALMGGLLIRVGSKLIDSSVRAKLERLHRALKTNSNSSDKAKMKEVA